MPSVVYNQFLTLLTTGGISIQNPGQYYGVILVDENYVFDADHATMADIANELTDSSYSRKITLLDSFVVNAADEFLLALDDVFWNNLTSTIGASGAILVKLAGATFGVPVNDKLLAFFAITTLPAAFENKNLVLKLNDDYIVKVYGN